MNEPMLSGFWRRFWADALDALLLFLLATLFSRPFTEKLFAIGESGLWIGLAITLLYSGILHTSLGAGQTLGKQLLGIQVVRLDGKYLSLPASLIRFLVLAYCTYNGVFYQGLTFKCPWFHQPVAQAANAAVLFAIVLGTVVMIPLHPLKRGLHDLVTGSIVVRKGRYDAVRLAAMVNREKENRAYAFLFMVFALTLSGLWAYLKRHPDMKESWTRLVAARQIAEDASELQNVSARETHFHWRDKTTENEEQRLIISGFVPRPFFEERASCAKQAEKIYQALLKHPEVLNKTHWVDVYLRTGWNLGIASYYQSTSYPNRVDMVTRDQEQYEQGVAWGKGDNPAILGRYKITALYPELESWKERYRKKDFVAIEKFVEERMAKRDELSWRFLDIYIPWMAEYVGEAGLKATKQWIDEWVQRRPQSWLPWTLRGYFYISWAWQARGTGFGNTISKEALRPLYERLDVAKNSLEKAHRLNPRQPFAAAKLVALSYALSLDRPTMEKYYTQAIKAAPWDRSATNNKIEYLTPKWGGTWKDVFDFVQQLKEKSKRYPLLGLCILQAHRQKGSFEPSYEDYLKRPDVWADIEGAYERIFKAYPEEIIYHMGFASVASSARRYDIAAQHFDLVGDRWVQGGGGYNSLADYNNARAYAYSWTGWNLIEHHQDKEGAAMFYKSYDYRKDDSFVLEKLAQWNRMSNHPDKAKEFEKAAAALKKTAPATPHP